MSTLAIVGPSDWTHQARFTKAMAAWSKTQGPVATVCVGETTGTGRLADTWARLHKKNMRICRKAAYGSEDDIRAQWYKDIVEGADAVVIFAHPRDQKKIRSDVRKATPTRVHIHTHTTLHVPKRRRPRSE